MPSANSSNLFKRARAVIPGGVNSPVRAFQSVGGDPVFIARGEGPYLFDVDGNKYIDLICSWGPLVLGHANSEVISELEDVISRGLSFGAPTELEVEMAERVCRLVPGVEMLRTTSSGTEATMSALRLARGFTGRELIVKCDGCYHGHGDSLLVKAGSGVATLGISGCPGVTEATASQTLTIPYNSLEALEEVVKVHGENIAAFILEPVPGNMGLVLPEKGYLEGVRRICSEQGIVLIFDEVMSGFRVALGGATARYGVTADLVTLGKVIGGGLPVGAFGGRKDIMEKLAPVGPVYQAGTLSGNPVAMTAGLQNLKALERLNPYPEFEERAQRLASGLGDLAKNAGHELQTNSLGSMFGFFFTGEPVSNFEEAVQADSEKFKKFFWEMFKRGVYLAPSAFEAGFLSTEHSEAVIDEVLEKAGEAFSSIQE